MTCLDFSEGGLLFFALLVAVGLIGERKLNWWHVRYDLFVTLVAIGCAGEMIADAGVFVFSRHLQTISDVELQNAVTKAGSAKDSADKASRDAKAVSDSADRANKSADRANGKAVMAESAAAKAKGIADKAEARSIKAEAEEAELRKETAPRRVSGEQKKKFLDDLKVVPGRTPTIAIETLVGVPDGEDFVKDLEDLFKQAGFSVTVRPPPVMVGSQPNGGPDGILLGIGKNRRADAEVLANALVLSRIVSASTVNAELVPDADGLMVTITNRSKANTSTKP